VIAVEPAGDTVLRGQEEQAAPPVVLCANRKLVKGGTSKHERLANLVSVGRT
jgi:hypothetical protein